MNIQPTGKSTGKPPRISEQWAISIAWTVGACAAIVTSTLALPAWADIAVKAASLVVLLVGLRVLARRPV